MKITMLGTGHGSVINCYNTCFTIDDGKSYFLVDSGGGNGIIKQLHDSDIDLSKIKNIFISHTHSDHILGVIWVIRKCVKNYYKGIYDEPMYIYGNDLVINAINEMCKLLIPEVFLYSIGEKIKLVVVKDNEKAKILNNNVTFFDINVSKVKQFGFYMELAENKKFTFIGDEVCSKSTEKYVQDSEWLFADAYMAGKKAEEYNPIEKHHHSTVKFTSELAERLNVKNLILSHSTDIDLESRKKEFIEDSLKYFSGNVFAPNDLEEIEINLSKK